MPEVNVAIPKFCLNSLMPVLGHNLITIKQSDVGIGYMDLMVEAFFKYSIWKVIVLVINELRYMMLQKYICFF